MSCLSQSSQIGSTDWSDAIVSVSIDRTPDTDTSVRGDHLKLNSTQYCTALYNASKSRESTFNKHSVRIYLLLCNYIVWSNFTTHIDQSIFFEKFVWSARGQTKNGRRKMEAIWGQLESRRASGCRTGARQQRQKSGHRRSASGASVSQAAAPSLDPRAVGRAADSGWASCVPNRRAQTPLRNCEQ